MHKNKEVSDRNCLNQSWANSISRCSSHLFREKSLRNQTRSFALTIHVIQIIEYLPSQTGKPSCEAQSRNCSCLQSVAWRPPLYKVKNARRLVPSPQPCNPCDAIISASILQEYQYQGPWGSYQISACRRGTPHRRSAASMKAEAIRALAPCELHRLSSPGTSKSAHARRILRRRASQ